MDLFLSYRRDSGLEIARNIKLALDKLRYSSFFDLTSVREGVFNEQLLKNIRNSDNFVVVLTPGSLDRCVNPDDWVRKEINEAIRLGKNIIPVICDGFRCPPELPQEIRDIVNYQGVKYSGYNFDDMIENIIKYLRDSENKALRTSKKRNIVNTYYRSFGMPEEERERIRLDAKVCKGVEDKIFDRLLAGKENVVVFDPAIYEIGSAMEKYDRPEISCVFGCLSTQKAVDEANAAYSGYRGKKCRFYCGDMSDGTFIDLVDEILSDNQINAFDFVNLTMILRDLNDPIKKLQGLADRINRGGSIFVRELDHGMACAYPDEDGYFRHLIDLLRIDRFAGDFEAGRKVYYYLKEADLEDVHAVNSMITTEGMGRREREMLFEVLFSYLPKEFSVLAQEDSGNSEYKDAVEWLEENYAKVRREFKKEDFFYRSGFMFFYALIG